MRASDNIAAGCFFGGIVEPGTFHSGNHVIGFGCGNRPDIDDDDTFWDFKPAGADVESLTATERMAQQEVVRA